MHFVFSLTHHLIKRQGKKARKKVIVLLRASQNPYININLGSLAPLHGLLSNSLIFGPISSDLLPFQSSLYIEAIDQKSYGLFMLLLFHAKNNVKIRHLLEITAELAIS